MKKFLKAIIMILLMFSIINIFDGCMDGKKNKIESLNILIEEPKESDNDFINTTIEEYKKENKNVNVKVEVSQNIEESNKILRNKKMDLILCSRNSMIEFSRKGLLKDIGNIYDLANINSRFYNIVCSYGRYNNTYYGIGLMPYSLNLLVNKNIVEEFLNKDEILDVSDIINIVSKYNKNIPVLLPKNINLSLALGSFMANNLIMDNKLEETFSDDKSGYVKMNEIQDSFNLTNSIIKELNNNKISFIESNEEVIIDVQKGKIPLVLTTTLSFKNMRQNQTLKAISSILDNKYKLTPLVIIDHNLCAFQNAENEKQVNKFFSFLCKDDIYIKLAQKGYVSGNEKGITYIEGMQREFIWTISVANENNIPFYFNLPNKMKEATLEELQNIINGKHDNNEWNRIINKNFE